MGCSSSRVEAPTETEEPLPVPRVYGSLIYNDASQGTLELHLTADSPAEGALAIFETRQVDKVPAWKLSRNQGRSAPRELRDTKPRHQTSTPNLDTPPPRHQPSTPRFGRVADIPRGSDISPLPPPCTPTPRPYGIPTPEIRNPGLRPREGEGLWRPPAASAARRRGGRSKRRQSAR